MKKNKKTSIPKSPLATIRILFSKYIWYLFFIILVIGLYLRFYHIQDVFTFGWDQGRDAWQVRDIIQGRLTLLGPRTGIGHISLGPVYYYLLVPFFYLTRLDPMGSNYFNLLANVVNYFLIFSVTKKIFGNYAAIFIILIYTLSHYLVTINQVPWNVTMMPGFAALIFFSIYKIYEGNNKWIFILWTVSGFYWNLHFTAIFIPIINILSLIFVKDKLKVLKLSLLSIPLYLIWFVPNIISMITASNNNVIFSDFIKNYYIGFHLRFLLHRIPDALIQFQTILYYPLFEPLKFILPVVFILCIIFEKDKRKRLLGYLISLWFLVPLIGFTMYGGPMTEYYFLYNAPMVLFIFVYLQEKLLKIKFVPFLLMLSVFWCFYAYQNTKDLWVKPNYGGLVYQKDFVKKSISKNAKFPFKEGDILAYLYAIWIQDKQKPF